MSMDEAMRNLALRNLKEAIRERPDTKNYLLEAQRWISRNDPVMLDMLDEAFPVNRP